MTPPPNHSRKAPKIPPNTVLLPRFLSDLASATGIPPSTLASIWPKVVQAISGQLKRDGYAFLPGMGYFWLQGPRKRKRYRVGYGFGQEAGEPDVWAVKFKVSPPFSRRSRP